MHELIDNALFTRDGRKARQFYKTFTFVFILQMP